MTDRQVFLLKLHKNLNTLRQREAKYAGNAPPELLNQIEDYEQAIVLTEQAQRGELSEEEWQEKVASLNVDLDKGGTRANINQMINLFVGTFEERPALNNRPIVHKLAEVSENESPHYGGRIFGAIGGIIGWGLIGISLGLTFSFDHTTMGFVIGGLLGILIGARRGWIIRLAAWVETFGVLIIGLIGAGAGGGVGWFISSNRVTNPGVGILAGSFFRNYKASTAKVSFLSDLYPSLLDRILCLVRVRERIIGC